MAEEIKKMATSGELKCIYSQCSLQQRTGSTVQWTGADHITAVRAQHQRWKTE